MLVGHGLRHRGHCHGFEPAQAPKLAARGAETIEHHGTDQSLGIDLTPARAQSTAERAVKAEVFPKLVKGKDIAVGERGVIGNVGGGVLEPSDRAIEAVDQWIELARAELVESAQIGNNSDAHLAVLVAMTFDELQVAAAARF